MYLELDIIQDVSCLIVEVDSNSFHPRVVGVSWIVDVTFINLQIIPSLGFRWFVCWLLGGWVGSLVRWWVGAWVGWLVCGLFALIGWFVDDLVG